MGGRTAYRSCSLEYLKRQLEAASRRTGLLVGEAMFILGSKYASGDGVNQDIVEAYVWYGRAAAGGNAMAESKREETAVSMTAAEKTRAERLLETQTNDCPFSRL